MFQIEQNWRDICSCAANETFSLMQDGRELCALTERVCRRCRFQAIDKGFQATKGKRNDREMSSRRNLGSALSMVVMGCAIRTIFSHLVHGASGTVSDRSLTEMASMTM